MTASELKKSVLQMAVEGKLTEQSEKDEPVEELLKRIKEEKESLIKEGKIKKDKTISEIYKKYGSYYERVSDGKNILKDACIDEELPFEIPDTWTWVRLGNISNFGECINAEPNTIPNDAWVLELEDIEKDSGKILVKKRKFSIKCNSTKHVFKANQILYSKLRPYLNKVIIPDEAGFCTSEILPILFYNKINIYYSQIYFMSPFFVSYAVGCSYGVKMPRLGSNDGKMAFYPLPPIEEQKRIVEKINLLMPLINEYDELEKSITKLNKEFPDNIKKSILQYAIEGKLTEQSQEDEPVEKLLKRIKEERKKLIKEGKIKKDKTTSEIYKKDGSYYERVFEGNNIVKDVCIDDELPFEIPDSWVWVRLGTLVSLVTDGTHKTPQYVDKGIPFLSVQNISKGFFDFTKIKYITEEEHEKLIKRVKPQLNDILICRVGTLGKALKCTLNIEFSIFVSLGLIRLVNVNIVDFIILLINSPLGDKWIDYYKIGGGTHTYKINLIDIPKMLFPLPPIEEQKRIVDKINRVNEVINTIKI